MFFVVFSFSGVSSFSSLHPSSLSLLCFRCPTFSAGSESLWMGGGGGLFVASPLRRWFFIGGVPSVAICCPVVSWSGKFPIERLDLWGWKSVSAVGVACPVLCWVVIGARRDSQLVRAVPDSTRGYLGRDWLGWVRALLSDGPLDCTRPSVLRAWCIGAHGEFQMAVLLVGCCLFRVWRLPSSNKCC